MYIKGISKVLIVITVLLSLFLVTPSKVEAAVDAPITCKTGYSFTSTAGFNDVCCPNSQTYKSIVAQAHPDYSTIIIKGQSYREVGSGERLCKIHYDASKDDGTFVENILLEARAIDTIIECPANRCTLKAENFTQKTLCYRQLESQGNLVCCIEKNKTPDFKLRANCVPDLSIAVNQFNQVLNPITPEEICKKDAGYLYKEGRWINNTSDTRPVSEKDLIVKDCTDCLKNPKNLWTAVGCVQADLNGVITTVIRIFYGIITVLMLLKLIIAGYKFYGGDPEQLKDSKMEIFSAIGAAFALTLGIIALRYIGIDILGIGAIDGISSELPILK